MLTDESLAVPAVLTKRLSDIREHIKQITACIEWWERKERGPFSWVDDCLSVYVKDKDFCYYLHAGWVPDWNRSERAQPMNAFLRQWITKQNIAIVLKVTEEWHEQQGDEIDNEQTRI